MSKRLWQPDEDPDDLSQKSQLEVPAKQVILRYRSAPWDSLDDEFQPDDQVSVTDLERDPDNDETDDSLRPNLLGVRVQPTHYSSVAVTAQVSPQLTQSSFVSRLLQEGASLPPPREAPSVFQKTSPSVLMDEAVRDLCDHGILVPDTNIVNTFRLFLVSKPDGAARPVLDISPWTAFYNKPPITLYSAAEVLTAIPRNGQLIKLDLKYSFFQLNICQEHRRFYGIYYWGQRFAWTRLPMGHPLAPSIMQRLGMDVARHLHLKFGISMAVYLDDWLIFTLDELPAQQIITEIQKMRIVINFRKSVVSPTTQLVYLGLSIDT